MRKVVILGAGKTGRGFVSRFMEDVELSFCDKNNMLIDQLNQQKSYQIQFFNNRSPVEVLYGICSCWQSEEARAQITSADVLCISIDISNYSSISKELNDLLCQRQTPLIIITFENGIDAGQILLDLCSDKAKGNCIMLDAGVFCTTDNLKGLSIISQDLDYLPIQDPKGIDIPFHSYSPIYNFSDLMKRKLYTYNCLSALICYLGYCKHKTWLSDASNDPQIRDKINCLLPELDIKIATLFQVSIEDQRKFSNSALLKFSDPFLKDSIGRNARNVRRKLGEDERLMKPLRLLDKEGKEILLETIACACIYDKIEETQQGICLLQQMKLSKEEVKTISMFYDSHLKDMY